MRTLDFPGGWYNWALPSGEYVVLITNIHFQTHQGVVPLDIENALFTTCTNKLGFRFAGQAHHSLRGTLEWNGSWRVAGPSFSVNPQIYDNNGALRIATGSHQGYRFVRPDNSLATGDETIYDPVKQLHEWTQHGDLTIGFHDETLSIWADDEGRRRIITRGWIGSNTAHLNRDGDKCVVSWQNQTENKVYIVWFDRNEIDQFELEEPLPQPEAPRCTITRFPTTVEFGQPALCMAAYAGGLATEARWLYRALGEVIWVTDVVQVPPKLEHEYHFIDAGQYDISLMVVGPGGSDSTTSTRRITVKEKDMPEEPAKRLQVAFGPNLGSLDLPQLFTESNLWQWSFDRISAFQLYVGHIIEPGSSFVNPNTWQVLVDSGLFRKLRETDVLLELQMGGESADQVGECVDKIAEVGGALGALCFDHSFIEVSPEKFAERRKQIKERWPTMLVGAYAPFPTKNAEQIRQQLVEWDRHGGRPDFLRMDIDYNQRNTYTSAAHNKIKLDCKDRGIALQVTINAKEHITDAEWVTQGKAWFDKAHGLGFDAYMVQSWASTPSNEQRTLPHNLPESDASSHTHLVRYCLERFTS